MITSINQFKEFKKESKKIFALTAYDALFANILEESDIDFILVGDSFANVRLGYSSTIPVTLSQMTEATKSVCKSVSKTFVVVDMPYMSYHISVEDTKRNAGHLIKETGAQAVKLEGVQQIHAIANLIDIHIPVMGHIGLEPQSYNALGGYRTQYLQNEKQVEKLLRDAKLLENSGVFALVLECVPGWVAKKITDSISIPTIGIGSGIDCDGQILVTEDAIGLNKSIPSFVHPYCNVRQMILDAVRDFKNANVSF